MKKFVQRNITINEHLLSEYSRITNKNPDIDNDPIMKRGILAMQLIMNFMGN